MTIRTALAATTALVALGGASWADTYKIGITQNNVGVDSYQTTYEQAFISAAQENDKVETVVLDAGGDVARQIAQIEDLNDILAREERVIAIIREDIDLEPLLVYRMKGIGSTPSFALLRALSDWPRRFEAFYVLKPHGAFTRIAGVTPPFPIDRPPPIAPVEMSLDELDAILAYVAQMEPADLGAPIRHQ